jgi:hypothetical protein
VADIGLAAVVELIEQHRGLLWHHCGDSRKCRGTDGLTDLIIVGPRSMLWAEVKPDAFARLSPGQISWKYALQALSIQTCCFTHVVWTQADVESGAVAAALESLL